MDQAAEVPIRNQEDIVDNDLLSKAQTLKNLPELSSTDPNNPLNKVQDVFLTLLGEKPASWVEVPVNADVDSLRETLGGLGLHSELVKEARGYRLIVSKDPKVLRQVLDDEVHPTQRNPKTVGDFSVGKLLGYPETAIRALQEWRVLEPEEQERFLKESGIYGKVHAFRMSKDNWQQELEILKKWAKLTEEYGLSTKSSNRGTRG